MSTILANGANVLRATLSFPRVGVWHATVDIDADAADAFVGRVEIDAGDAGVFVGTTPPNGVNVFVGRVRARVIGGAAGFGTICEPKFYRSMVASTVLRDVLDLGGEELSGTATGIDSVLPFWTRPEASVGEAFEELVASLGLSWRVLDDGTVWVGEETWPEAQLSADALVLEENPAERTAVLSDGEKLRPGQTYEGKHVGRVEIAISPQASRTTAWFQESDADGDPVRVALTKIVRQMTRTIDFLAAYPARVVKQNDDGTLELKLKSERMPAMSKIPIRYGIPGIRAKVKPGGFVNVEFEHGDPSMPCATVWDRESVSELTVKADKVIIDAADVDVQKGRPLARVGDMVQVISTAPGTPAIGQIMTGNNMHRG
jgi:hypothetical protein